MTSKSIGLSSNDLKRLKQAKNHVGKVNFPKMVFKLSKGKNEISTLDLKKDFQAVDHKLCRFGIGDNNIKLI